MLLAGAVALVVFGVLLSYLDWREVRDSVLEADLVPLLWAVAFSLASLAAMSISFGVFARIFQVHLPLRDLSEIGFVSLAFGRLISSTGLPGYVLRILLTERQGAVSEHVLAASLFHSMSNDLVLFGLVPVGLGYLLAHHSFTAWQSTGLTVVAFIFLALIALWMSVMLITRARRRILRWVNRVWHKVSKKDIGHMLMELDGSLEEGTRDMRHRPYRLVVPLTLILVDWAAAIVALDFCFRAFGTELTTGVLVTGFAISMWAAFISQLPGGLGVMEGSMAGIYSYLGAPLETAVLAALLYRVVYYLVPFAISILFYLRLLRRPFIPHPHFRRRRHAEAAASAPQGGPRA